MEIYDEFGNHELLARRKTAFLCSRQVPAEYHGRIIQWANELDHSHCVVCGCSTNIERQVAAILLERGISLIWLALDLNEVKNEIDHLRSYVISDRILILALFGEGETLPKRQQQYMRNLAVLEYSDQIVVGYRTPDGTLDHQIAGRENIQEIISQSEEHRYQDFLHLEESRVYIEIKEGLLRIVQHRQTANNAEQREMISLTPNDAIRLRNALDHAIESNQWAESRYAEIRQQYSNAYRPWTPEDEIMLRQLSLDGQSDDEIAQILGRQPSAVASRLQRLIEKDSQQQEQSIK